MVDTMEPLSELEKLRIKGTFYVFLLMRNSNNTLKALYYTHFVDVVTDYESSTSELSPTTFS